MPTIVKRITKGSVLTLQEYDDNLDAVNVYRLLPTGEWKFVPSLFRLLLKGTGTCLVESRNTEGAVATITTYTAAAATNQIEYPYLGADAIEIRVTLTGTCTAEVI